MISFAVFVFGLAIGSFLNAFIYRLEVQQGLRQIPRDHARSIVSVMRGRSFCPHCGHALSWSDLIPLLSFVFLRGKCRYCHQKISLQYPVVELATALVFVFLALSLPKLGLGVNNLVGLSFLQMTGLAYLWIVSGLLIVIFVYDVKHFLISDKILYPAIGLVFLWRVYEVWSLSNWGLTGNWKLEIGNFEPLIFALLSAIGASAFFLAIYVVSRGRWMGFGDVKLAFLLGLFLGWPSILVALFFAFFLGAVFGLTLIALRKKGLKSEVPFAPFLIVGTAIAYFFGSYITNFYMNLIL